MIKNSCIFYLVNNNPIHLRRLYRSLELLNQNVLSKYPYPVVFGHEGIPDELKDIISSKLNTTHYFHKVDFKLPDYPQEIRDRIPEKFKGHWDENAFFSMGYRHMCRYFAGGIYKDEFFEKVNYLWRLDCDSYITDELEQDPFEVMQQSNAAYGFISLWEDEDYVIEGLHDFTANFFGQEFNLLRLDPKAVFATHFEIVDFKKIRSSKYMDYFDAIDKSGNIYIKRWGDAPIKYKGINAVFDSTNIYQFNLPYKHGGDYV